MDLSSILFIKNFILFLLMSNKAVIELENVWKTYQVGDVKVDALRGVDISIKNGEFVSITGASGSGKSTMMNMVGALDTPSKGTIYLDNKNISKLSESNLAVIRGKKIGFVFQQFNLISTLTAIENVMLPMEFQDSEDVRQKATKVLELVGLKDRMNHKPKELSGGQQQRVAIARALANNPEVILADEPTGNLDSKTGKEIMSLFEKLNGEGKTIILITHDLNLIKYSHRVIKLADGQVIGGKK